MLINNFADDVDALAFWDIISEQVKKCELSTALCLTEKGLIHLKNKQIDKTKVSVINLFLRVSFTICPDIGHS